MGTFPFSGAPALVPQPGTWQGEPMPAHRPSAAGGAPIALGAVGGAVIGFIQRAPTLWFLAGLSAGILVALLIWWRGR